MRRRRGPRISKSLIRALSAASDLPLDESRLDQAANALAQFTREQQSLYDLDLTTVEPPFVFDPRWD